MTAADPLAALCAAWLAGEGCGPALYDLIEESARWQYTPYGWTFDPGLGVITAWVSAARMGPLGYYWGLNLWGTPAHSEPRGFAPTAESAQAATLAALRRALAGG